MDDPTRGHDDLLDSLTEAARGYVVDRGWWIFPCTPRGKTPLIDGGFHAATTDISQVDRWWDKWPDANIGVACGVSRLAVVDVDQPGGPTTLTRLIGDGYRLPPTLTQLTGGGGCQYLYTAAGGLRNTTARLPGVPYPTPNIDVRAEGGYIIVPPSVTTGEYEWVRHWPIAPAPAPRWLTTPPPPPRPRIGRQRSRFTVGPGRLEGLANKVRNAPVGKRNAVLNWAAYTAREIDDPRAPGVLAQAGHDAGLGELEVEATVASGLGIPRTTVRR